MTMPTMAAIIQFIFQHDKWLKNQQEEWEVANFLETVEFIANRHYIQDIPAVAEIKQQAGEIVRAGAKWRYYHDLDINLLVSVDNDGDEVRIRESWFGRAIPLEELFDWLMHTRGHATKIIVNPAGMKVTTSHGATIMVPGCEIYLGRLAEDGIRYRNACLMIRHITGDSIELKPADLVNKTQNITVELTDGEWTVNTGIPATTP